MGECECIQACPFFNGKMTGKPGMIQIYKNLYCLGKNGNSDCARYAVRNALGKDKVPSDLYPNEMYRARKMIKEKRYFS